MTDYFAELFQCATINMRWCIAGWSGGAKILQLLLLLGLGEKIWDKYDIEWKKQMSSELRS